MSTSGKGKKKKYRLIAIETTVRPTTSWAEEVESELMSEHALKKINSISLPTAPRAACDLVIDESKIPANGPFVAYLHNLPYEITEEDISNQFKELKIENIQLPRDRHDRMKGFGYIEFRDKSSLLVALQEGEVTLKGRSVRISLPEEENKGSRGNTSFTRNRDMSDRFDKSSSDKPMEWRTAAPIPHDPEKSAPKHSVGFTRQQNFREREREGGGPFRESRSSFASDFDSKSNSSFSRAFRDRDRDRDRDDGRSSDHSGGGNRMFKRFDRDRMDRDRDDRGGNRSTLFGKKFERDDRDREYRRESVPEREEPKTRPKIELQPRSVPIDTNPLPAALPSSIFGAAKPVDTAKREMEIEKKMASTVNVRGRPASPANSITPNISRSSSVSSVSSMKKQHFESAESANETSKPSRPDTEERNENERPKQTEFKEPAPPPQTNYWQKRSEENAAVFADRNCTTVETTVIDDADVAETSEKSEETQSSQPLLESSGSTPAISNAVESNDSCSETNERPVVEKSRDTTQWTSYSHESFNSNQQSSGSRHAGRYENSKFGSFSRDNRSDSRREYRKEYDRRDGDRQGTRFGRNRDDNYSGNRSESINPFSGKFNQNRDGGHFRNRNGTAPGPRRFERDDGRGSNLGSFRDRNDHGSATSLRSSASSITNLRDEGQSIVRDHRNDDRKFNDERLTGSDTESNTAVDDAKERTKSFEQQRQQHSPVDDRLQSSVVVASDRPLENGNENRAEFSGKQPSSTLPTTHSQTFLSADASDLNDNSFSSSKSRKKDKKKKADKNDESGGKDILKPIENERKPSNQKDEKKKATDGQIGDKSTTNNNAKNKEGRSKKAAKKSREIRDDASQIPKQKEEKAPNFEGSNRYLSLVEDDS